MMSLPRTIDNSDVIQWLEGGYFYFRPCEEADLIIASLAMVDDCLTAVGLDDAHYRWNADNVFPHWPECGAINLEGYAVHVKRLAVRQYRRTYNDAGLSVHVPRKWDVMKRFGTDSGRVNPNSAAVVEAVFRPRYYTYSHFVDSMFGAVSAALNPHVIVTRNLVYYRGELVAKLLDDKIVPFGCDKDRVQRLVKHFDGRVRL